MICNVAVIEGRSNRAVERNYDFLKCYIMSCSSNRRKMIVRCYVMLQ